MRTLILFALAGCAFGQMRQNGIGHQPLNPVGQGNILHPGIPMSGPPHVHTRPNAGAFASQGRTVYVPYGVPIDPFYSGHGGGYGYGGGFGYSGGYAAAPAPYDPNYGAYDPSGAYGPGGQTPTVIINQNFLPDTAHPVLHDYSNTQLPPDSAVQVAPQQGQPAQVAGGTAQRDDQPTIFLIAMKDHTIYPVIAYWVDKDTLNYVTVETTVKRVPMDQVDRDLSRQLNDQRNVEFKLPAPTH